MTAPLDPTDNPGPTEDIVTIVAPTLDEAMARFRARGLAAEGYAITGQARRHRFELAGETGGDMFEGTPMIAATFRRASA